jgi:hypothetical protein
VGQISVVTLGQFSTLDETSSARIEEGEPDGMEANLDPM